MKKKDNKKIFRINDEESELFPDYKSEEKSKISDQISNSQNDDFFDDSYDEFVDDIDYELDECQIVIKKLENLFSYVIENGCSADILVEQFEELESKDIHALILLYIRYIEVFFNEILAFDQYPGSPYKKFPFEQKKNFLNYSHDIISRYVYDYYEYKRIMTNIENNAKKIISNFYSDFNDIAPKWIKKLADHGLDIE